MLFSAEVGEKVLLESSEVLGSTGPAIYGVEAAKPHLCLDRCQAV